jgi:hypothetical protein
MRGPCVKFGEGVYYGRWSSESRSCHDFAMDDLDSIYELVYADSVVKNAWSGRQGTPEDIKMGFAKEWIAPHSEFGLKALAFK